MSTIKWIFWVAGIVIFFAIIMLTANMILSLNYAYSNHFVYDAPFHQEVVWISDMGNLPFCEITVKDRYYRHSLDFKSDSSLKYRAIIASIVSKVPIYFSHPPSRYCVPDLNTNKIGLYVEEGENNENFWDVYQDIP